MPDEVSPRLITGLGNPGAKYADTPHNAGFWVVDELAQRHAIHFSRQEGDTLVGAGRIRNFPVLLAKPQTFMNNSGVGVASVLRYRKLTHKELVLVYDELDLTWGALRIKTNGSAAGHNGVKSVIAALKTDEFVRVRMGIRPEIPYKDAAVYVLAPLNKEQQESMREMASYTADAIECIIAEGADKAMATFNRRRAPGLQEEK